jgi:glycosyltransferase involved in cell wall biosynthesis
MPASWVGICVVDPSLRDFVGHDFNYASNIGRAICARCLEFRVLAAGDCLPGIREALPIEPVFRPLPMGPSSRHNRAVRALEGYARLCSNYARFSSDLAAVDKSYLDGRWILFMENANQFNLLAWSRWLRRFQPTKSPAFAVMLRYSYFDKGRGRWRKSALLVRAALRTLEKASRNHRIHLVADSQELADEYRSLTRLPVSILPTPLTCHLSSPRTVQPSSSSGATHVLLPGRPSLSKGVATFALAIKRLTEGGLCSGLTFTLQDYDTPFREPELARSIAMLQQLSLPNLNIIQKSLDEDGYYQLMSEADLIVLPYFQEDYHAMVSGPFVEALALGKPVVVTEHTWMSAQLKRFGAGLTVRDRDAEDLARAICAARDGYQHLAEQASARQESWLAYHNPRNFVEELLKVVEPR